MKSVLFAVSAVASSVVLAGPASRRGRRTGYRRDGGGFAFVDVPIDGRQQRHPEPEQHDGLRRAAGDQLGDPADVCWGRSWSGRAPAAELSPMHSGLAAGDDPLGWQAWIQGGGGSTVNSLATGGYNIANYGTQLGLQAQITPKFLLGVSGSWQGSSGTLNGGFSSTNSTFGVTAYAGWQFNEHWNVSAMAGYSSGTNTLTNSGFNYNANYAQQPVELPGRAQRLLQGGRRGAGADGVDPLFADQQLRLHRQQPGRRARPDDVADPRLGRRLHQPAARQVAALRPRHHRAGFRRCRPAAGPTALPAAPWASAPRSRSTTRSGPRSTAATTRSGAWRCRRGRAACGSACDSDFRSDFRSSPGVHRHPGGDACRVRPQRCWTRCDGRRNRASGRARTGRLDGRGLRPADLSA